MFMSLSISVWAALAAAVTPVHIAVMRWCMPTPRTKLNMSFGPLVSGIVLLMSALVKGYSPALTLFLYSGILITFIIMLAPVRKRISAGILEQEKNPLEKVSPDMGALWWCCLSGMACVIALIYPLYAMK